MTVKELAEALLALPAEDQGKEVKTEGCDCYGDAGRLEVDADHVIICREKEGEE